MHSAAAHRIMASPTTVSAQPCRPSRRSVNSTMSWGLVSCATSAPCSALGCGRRWGRGRAGEEGGRGVAAGRRAS